MGQTEQTLYFIILHLTIVILDVEKHSFAFIVLAYTVALCGS